MTKYYLQPIENFPDKIIKMTDERTIVLWKNNDEYCHNFFKTEDFKKKNPGRLIEISEIEYIQRFGEFFPQFVHEAKK
jgi:hypothetical protein